MFGFLKKKVQEETPDTFIVGGLLFLQPRKPDDMDPIINGLVGQVEKRLVSEIGIYQFLWKKLMQQDRVMTLPECLRNTLVFIRLNINMLYHNLLKWILKIVLRAI